MESAATPLPPISTDNQCTLDEDLSDLPWHHAQLAMLYGRQAADEIVHPKIERKQVTIDPNLKSESKQCSC